MRIKLSPFEWLGYLFLKNKYTNRIYLMRDNSDNYYMSSRRDKNSRNWSKIDKQHAVELCATHYIDFSKLVPNSEILIGRSVAAIYTKSNKLRF